MADVLVVACRAVVPTRTELFLDAKIGTPYPDSTRAECVSCGRDIWMGPRQRAIAERHPAGQVRALCLTCAALLATAVDAPTLVASLDNPSLDTPQSEGPLNPEHP